MFHDAITTFFKNINQNYKPQLEKLLTLNFKFFDNLTAHSYAAWSITIKKSDTIIRELGFANIALCLMGLLSIIHDQWYILAAISGGLFFGFAAASNSKNEWIALLHDSIVFLTMILYLLQAWFAYIKTI